MEGYKVKKGKYLTFFAPGQEKGTRGYTIGDNYSEEAIRCRILNKDKETEPQTDEVKKSDKKNPTSKEKKQLIYKKKVYISKRINLLVDISKNIKAQQSKAYENALIRSNINTLVKTMNFLIAHKITTSEDFKIYAEFKNAEYSLRRKDIRKLESEMMELSEKIKFTQSYKKNAHVFYESKRARDPAAYAREHGDELTLFKASEIYFQRKQLKPNEINLAELFERYKELSVEKKALDRKNGMLKQEIKELDVVAENIEKAIGEDIAGKEEHHEDNVKKKEKGIE